MIKKSRTTELTREYLHQMKELGITPEIVTIKSNQGRNMFVKIGKEKLTMNNENVTDVVRCKECQFWDKTWNPAATIHNCRMLNLQTEESFFCKYGKCKDFMNPPVLKYDYEPVEHGYWIPVKVNSGRNSWECSVCGRHARGELKNLPYCHCGAKMDLRDR